LGAQVDLLASQPETDFHIFVRGGWINIWGGCRSLLWPGRGGNAQKGQGKSLTKFVLGLHGEI
jgi:hypothetical protein